MAQNNTLDQLPASEGAPVDQLPASEGAPVDQYRTSEGAPVYPQLKPDQQQQAHGQRVPMQVNPNAVHQNQAQGQCVPLQVNPQQNVVAVRPGNAPRNWTFGLCECFDDMSACCMTFWCPCLTAGEIWEKGLEKSYFAGCCLWFLIYPLVTAVTVFLRFGFDTPYFDPVVVGMFCYPCCWTGPLRKKRDIQGSCFEDFCCIFWCRCCQMIREVREAKLMNDETLKTAMI